MGIILSRYRSFAHPDSWLNELIAFCSSTLLSMFAMPNDVTLATIHLLPKAYVCFTCLDFVFVGGRGKQVGSNFLLGQR